MSNDASEPKLCPKCQAPLPADAPQGLCPRCLLAAASIPTEAGQPAGRPAPPSIEEIAASFPQLEILEFIGQGGMGFVFKARQPKLDRLVALKILPQSLAADPTFAERFNREAKLLARLNHPGIVTVHDFGVATGRAGLPIHQGDEAVQQHPANPFYYLLMEFVDGVNLRQAMQAGRFTPDQALAIVPKICEALQFAHNEGILHRDIKPENILLDGKGRVKIADFGIAKLVAAVCDRRNEAEEDLRQSHTVVTENLTEAGKTLGSPNYMAPEQLEHPGEVDHRADIYSLGVVFYEMLTGELPLGRFAPPSQKSTADPRVDEVVLRALEKERERRQHSAGEVGTQVETIAATPPGSSRCKSAQTAKSEIGKPGESRLTGFQILLRSVGVAFVAGLLGFALAAMVTSPSHKAYAATARVELTSLDPYSLQDEFARMVSPDFLKQVAAAADLKTRWENSISGNEAEQTAIISVRLRNAMELRPLRNTKLILISFNSESPGEAADIANAIATVYCSQPGTKIVDKATVPTLPVRRNAMLNLAIGVVGGSFFGLVAGGLTALFLATRKSHPSSGSRGDEAHSEKLENENRKSGVVPRFSRTAIIVAMWLVIIGGVLVFALVRNHIAKPTGMPLSETEFLQKFEANQIERATVSYNSQSLVVAKISGTYYRTDKDGNIIKTEKEVPFIVENALITPDLEKKLVRSDKIVFNTPNPIPAAVAANVLFFLLIFGGIGMAVLVLIGIIIYVVSRAVKKPVGTPTPPVQKPDRFWRWFAVAVFALIAIPFLISIVGLLAAIAIPNFIKARAQSQENARRAAAQLTTKTIVLTRATNQLVGTMSDTRTVGVWSDTTALPGEKFRQITRLPDGETTGADASLFSRSKAGKLSTSTSFTWWFREGDGFGAEEAEAAAAQIREHWTQTPLTFTSSAPREVFCVTNQHGVKLAGSIEFVRTAPQLPDAAGQIKATVQVKHFGDFISYPGIGFRAEVPDGYELRATSNYGEGEIHSPAGPYDYDATWFPMNYGLRQPAVTALSWNLKHTPPANAPSMANEPSEKFEILLGQPRLIVSITNSPDDVFQGFLELVGPPELGRQSFDAR